MQQLELSESEQQAVANALQTALTTLELEIKRADSIDYKNMLKERHHVLEQVLSRLPPATAPKPMLV
jgi:hypothetical protein